MEDFEKRIEPDQIIFGKSFMTAEKSQGEKYRIFYKDIVWAYISVQNDRTGCWEEPDIADVTEDLDGELVVCDRKRCRWVMQTDRSGQTAGSLLKKLCISAPYIVAGGQDWFDISKKPDFDMVRQMVKVKRACMK